MLPPLCQSDHTLGKADTASSSPRSPYTTEYAGKLVKDTKTFRDAVNSESG